MKFINFIMGLAAIGLGAYALYLTAAERRKASRSGLTAIVRAGVGLVLLIIGVFAILSAAGVIFRTPAPY